MINNIKIKREWLISNDNNNFIYKLNFTSYKNLINLLYKILLFILLFII